MAITVKEELRPEALELIPKIKKIAEERWLPHRIEFDALGGAQCLIKIPKLFNAVFRDAKDTGVWAYAVPKEYGGLGLNLVEQGIMSVESIKYGWSLTFGQFFNPGDPPVSLLNASEFPEVKEKYMRRILEGGICGVFMTEGDSGVDYGSMKSTGVRQGNNYVINGQKWWLAWAYAGPFEKNFHITMVKTDPQKRTRGLTLFIVDHDTAGIKRGREGNQVGMRAWPRWEINFENVVVPERNRIGVEGMGLMILQRQLATNYGLASYTGVGVAECTMDHCISHSKQTVRFGRPISQFQAVYHQIADMAIGAASGRALAHKACLAYDQDPNDMEAIKLLIIANRYCSEMSRDVTTKGMVLFAGKAVERGEGNPIEMLWRETTCLNLMRTPNLDRMMIATGAIGEKLPV